MNNNGQSVVEFTLVFLIFLIVAVWIPVDFGLAFYTAHIAQNAASDGARIAALEKKLVSSNCIVESCSGSSDEALKAAAKRMKVTISGNSVLPEALISVNSTGGCTGSNPGLVSVSVSGNYNFAFYSLLRFIGFSVPTSVTITRCTSVSQESYLGKAL